MESVITDLVTIENLKENGWILAALWLAWAHWKDYCRCKEREERWLVFMANEKNKPIEQFREELVTMYNEHKRQINFPFKKS